MPRNCLLIIGLLAASMLPSGGCRSCSSCHDYDPPVANCEGNACGCRAGSVSGGYVSGGYAGEEYSTGENAMEAPMEKSMVEESASPTGAR